MNLIVETVDSTVKDVRVSCYPPAVGKVSPELEGEAEPALFGKSCPKSLSVWAYQGCRSRQQPHHLDLQMYVVRHLWR